MQRALGAASLVSGERRHASGHVRDGAIAERHHTTRRGVVGGPSTGDPDRRTLDIVSTPRVKTTFSSRFSTTVNTVCETVDRGAGMTFFFKITSPRERWLCIRRETLEDAEYYIHNLTDATDWKQVTKEELPNEMQFREIALSVSEGYLP